MCAISVSRDKRLSELGKKLPQTTPIAISLCFLLLKGGVCDNHCKKENDDPLKNAND